MLAIRIVRWYLKLAYAVGAYLVAYVIGFPIGWVLGTVGSPPLVLYVVSATMTIAGFMLGARIFRGRGEAVEPPRAWWRMTARPRLSERLGAVFVILTAVSAIGTIVAAARVPLGRPGADDATGVADWVIATLLYGVLAYLYINSTVRLRRLGVPPAEPKFRPTIRVRP